MSHDIDMSNNRANIAYAGKVPWHGLGSKLEPDAGLDAWRTAAGLDWEILTAPIYGRPEVGEEIDCDPLKKMVLYRSDTNAPLSVMSSTQYKIVQPETILKFISDSASAMNWQMETAGSIQGGRKIWALANIGEEAELLDGDTVKGYLLAATSCDGHMATQFMFTSIRVVCNNTLGFAVNDADRAFGRNSSGKQDGQRRLAIYHSTEVDIEKVKASLGIATQSWGLFIEKAKRLATMKLSKAKARNVLREVFERDDDDGTRIIEGKAVRITDAQFVDQNRSCKRIMELYEGAGIGTDLKSAKGTAWGLVNATTEYLDFENGRTADTRLRNAWFGRGDAKKRAMFDSCVEMA